MTPLRTPHSALTPPSELVAIYRRVSTDHQDNSLVLQEKRVLEYASFRGFHPTEELTFSDPDVSGRTPMLEREGGRALMNRLKHGDVRHVVIAKLDRLGRNVRDAVGILETLKAQNVTLHIVDLGGESISTQGHMGRLVLTMLLAIAEWEVEEIRDRVTKQLRSRFDSFQLTGKVPYGYNCLYTFEDQSQHTSPSALSEAELLKLFPGRTVKSKLLVNCAEEQGWIHYMAASRWGPDYVRLLTDFELCEIATGLSLKAIADDLNARQIRTKLGKPWQCGSVDGVLTSRHTLRLLTAPLATEQRAA